MPTKDQCQELIDNTTHSWVVTRNGVYGTMLTSKFDSTKHLFLPAGGYCDLKSNTGAQTYVYYWSTDSYNYTVSDPSTSTAFMMYSFSYYSEIKHTYRYTGYSVRAIP